MMFFRWLKSLFSKGSSPVETPTKTKYQWNEYWSEILRRNIFPKLATFDAASDITTLRPDWKLLTDEQKCEVLVCFFKSLAFYESGYNPRSESVDVGKRNNKETWSVGLLQLSGTDKETLKLPIGFDYEGLKDPENNLIEGIAIMVNQIRKRGKIIIPYWEKGNPGVYWATLNPGNSSHDQSKYIITDVRNLTFEKEVIMSDVPWMAIAEKELGVTETNNPKRVIEYHQATSLKAQDTATAWCSSWVCWVLEKAGYKTTNSAWARDWLKYGEIADKQRGCIMVFERGSVGGSSHVAFYTGKETSTGYLVLGGNQGDSVCIKEYSKKDLLGCRWPIKA